MIAICKFLISSAKLYSIFVQNCSLKCGHGEQNWRSC